MNLPPLKLRRVARFSVLVPASLLAFAATAPAQQSPDNGVAEKFHQNMMDQLGITELRHGANGFPQEGDPYAANYDEARAGPAEALPDVLKLDDGTPVTSAEVWWKKRRPEIVEDFEREVYGRIPKNVPAVKWEVAETREDGVIGGVPVVGRRLIGRVDNSADPDVKVEIEASLVVPKGAKKPVPVLVMFMPGALPLPGPDGLPQPSPRPGASANAPAGPSSQEILIRHGWGYAALSTTSIQADNGAGLAEGIIGLVNKGGFRAPDQWGALRAWGWGASRLLDYLETDPAVDSSRVGIEGVSRYGKAALVTMAFDPRFAMGLIGSSGKGGATLQRRDFGERVENLAGVGEDHWMAGNYLKYAAEKSTRGRMDANALPVDSHELIALCAPRLTFISYGIPEQGDANWLDHRGSYMATVAAQPVFELLGAKGIGVSESWNKAEMPPVGHGLLDGELAWRQHAGGHEDRSNMEAFVEWADGKWADKK